jgi:hypothetical protein
MSDYRRRRYRCRHRNLGSRDVHDAIADTDGRHRHLPDALHGIVVATLVDEQTAI